MNRFTQLQGVKSNYEEQFYQPNFQLLQQALQNQQTGYDVAQEVTSRMPEHFRGDREAAKQYQEQMQQQMQGVTEAYMNNGIQGGNVARRSAMMDVAKEWQPGGKASNLEKNNAAIKEYEQRLNAQMDSGFISPKVKEAMMKNYVNNFQSYDGDNFTEFQGKDAAQHVELQSELAQHAQTFAAQAESNTGVKVGNRKIFKNMGGQYWEVVNGQVEYKDEEELKKFLRQTYEGSDRMKSFIQQENDLFGTGDEQIDNAINAVAGAASYERKSYQSQFLQNRGFITPEMRARAKKEEENTKPVNKTRVGALIANDIQLAKVPTKEEDVENAKDFRQAQIMSKMKAEQDALDKKYDYQQGFFNTAGDTLSRLFSEDAQKKYQEYVEEVKAITDKYADQIKTNDELYDKIDTLSVNDAYEMYNSPEGRRNFPHMGFALDRTQRKENQNLEAYMDEVKVNAEAIRDVYNQSALLSDVPETGSKEYDKVQEEMIKNRGLLSTQVKIMNGQNGVSETSKFVDILEAAGYGKFNLKDPKEVQRLDGVMRTLVSQAGQMRAGQNFGEVSDAIPQGHLFTIPDANKPGVSYTLLAKDKYVEQDAYATRINNFALPLYNLNANLTKIIDPTTGQEQEGFGAVIGYPSIRIDAEGNQVDAIDYYAMRPDVQVRDGVATKDPKLYRVESGENNTWKFADMADQTITTSMGTPATYQVPRASNLDYTNIIKYHNANLKNQQEYAGSN